MNIWYISKYVTPPGRGTVGVRGYELMRELATLGHKVSIVTSDSNHLVDPPHLCNGHLLEHVDGISLCWMKTLKYTSAKSLRRILSWLHFEWKLLWIPVRELGRPDVIVVSSLSLLTIFNGLRWRFVHRCRLVFEVRDIWPLTLVEEGGFSQRNPLVMFLAWAEYVAYRFSNEIVGTMPNLNEHVRDVLGYERKVHCIPMGVREIDPLENAVPLTSDLRQLIPNDKFVVAHVGSIGITNALDTLFECAELMQDNADVCFLIVGGGDLREIYKTRYGHLTNVLFGPKVVKAMVPSVLRECNLLYFAVHKSRVWRYGQSLNKIIDYMLSEKPIVASFDGYPSMINEAQCGVFVPTEDAIALREEIERYRGMDNSTRATIGARGKTWLCEQRTYKKLAKDYEVILEG